MVLPSGACKPLASPSGTVTEGPAVEACLHAAPPLFSLWRVGCPLLFLVSPRRYWDREVSSAEKDAREPSLMKAIIKCYWKPYLAWGILMFLEVKLLHTVLCFSVYVAQS